MFTSRLRRLEMAMAEAASYSEWRDAAIAHDEASGAAGWKQVDESEHFDHVSIRKRLEHLESLRSQGDDHGLLFTLNEGIHGNMGGMGVAALFGKAKFGTKAVITDYIEAVADALVHLADPATDGIAFEDKLDFFRRASHCFGYPALLPSRCGQGAVVRAPAAEHHLGFERRRTGRRPDVRKHGRRTR